MDAHAAALLTRIREFAMPFGAPRCGRVLLCQVGEMRMAPDAPWVPFTGEQTFTPLGLDFSWKAHSRVLRWLPATVIDEFQRQNGTVSVHLLGVFRIARFRGAAVDKGEIMRGLAEMPWRPFGFAEQPNLIWEATGEENLRVTFDDGRVTASVNFELDNDGRVLSVNASDRPHIVGKSVVEIPWSGTFEHYDFFGKVRVPTRAEVRWHLPEGPFDCWHGRITEFRLFEDCNS